MGSLLQTVSLPLFAAIRPGALAEVPAELAAANLSFERALVLSGPGPTARVAARLAEHLENSGMAVRVEALGDATFEEVDRAKREFVEGFFPQLIVATGGGRVIDVAKLVAAEKRLPWISVPTAGSNDGFCSPVAVLRASDGRRSLGGVMPLGVVADLDVIGAADRRHRLAGVGDLIGNLTACHDWQRAALAERGSVNAMARTFALSGARQVLAARRPDVDAREFLELVIEGLLLSGVAMEVSGSSRPCSGSEHLVSHELDRVGAGRGSHGEQVGVATLFCTALERDPEELRAFARRAGMPLDPPALGVDRATFLACVERAPQTRPGRWTVLSEFAGDRALLESAYERAFGG